MSQQAVELQAIHAPVVGAPSLVALDGGQLALPEPRALYPAVVKPAFDRLIGVVLLLLFVPLLLILALSVRAMLGHGVIYRQRRVGVNGRAFTMYKFRTMHRDRRVAPVPFDGPDRRVSHKRDDDPRHTPFGRSLRRWSLDELPQLWNIVRGDMSLVGPRPELVHVVETYEPWQHARHAVKPGLTGLWQVSARGTGLMREQTAIDLRYVEELSLLTDLRIIVRTVPAVLGSHPGN